MSSIQEKWNDRSKIPRCACFFPCPRGFYFHVLCTIAMEYLLTWNEFSAFPICLFFPKLFKIVEWYVPAKGWSSVVIGEFSEMCSHISNWIPHVCQRHRSPSGEGRPPWEGWAPLPQTSQLLVYLLRFSQFPSCDLLHLGQISIIANIVFLCISFFCANHIFSHFS